MSVSLDGQSQVPGTALSKVNESVMLARLTCALCAVKMSALKKVCPTYLVMDTLLILIFIG